METKKAMDGGNCIKKKKKTLNIEAHVLHNSVHVIIPQNFKHKNLKIDQNKKKNRGLKEIQKSHLKKKRKQLTLTARDTKSSRKRGKVASKR